MGNYLRFFEFQNTKCGAPSTGRWGRFAQNPPN